MSGLPQQKQLAMNMRLPVCERCMQRGGELQYMGLIVGRDFAEDFGHYWYECDRCKHLVGPFDCPLYWLSATNLDELNQILAYEHQGATVSPLRLSDLSPPAMEVLSQFGTNPFALAEAMAQLALKRGAAEARIKELEEQLADRDE
jgi:hypothetical protein